MSDVLRRISKFSKIVAIEDYQPTNIAALNLKPRVIPDSTFIEANKEIEPKILQNRKEYNASIESMYRDHSKVRTIKKR